MRHRVAVFACVFTVPFMVVSLAGGQAAPGATMTSTPPRTEWGHADLRGTWSQATLTPLQRPKQLADKEFLTEDEAAAYAKQVVTARDADAGRQRGTARDLALGNNEFWYDRGNEVVSSRRTSLIVDPRDGQIPPLTPEGQARASRAIPYNGAGAGRSLDSHLDRGLWERCITLGLPDVMLPMIYNNNYQILQTPEYIAILVEMIHDVRIIPLDGRPHLSPSIRQWMGDSRGRWEGDTLVVDTTNFTHKTSFRGSEENLHLIERFTRIDEDTLAYRVTIDDPTTFTKPWTIELPARKADGLIYEFACHEGNYGLFNALSGARAIEKAAEEAAKKELK